MPNQKPFYLGLCLAGAVSAGAYTAGVIDYLLEALETWQKRKDANTPETPTHDVVIPVIGGASAGGMTGIMTAALINQPHTPLTDFPAPLHKPQLQNRLYHSWVDLTDDDMFPLLLSTSDIKSKSIYSLLNSGFIDQIADRVVNLQATVPPVFPKYVDRHLKIFTTLSNLKGFEYNIAFNSSTPGANRYMMSRHNDFACFVLNKQDNQYAGDGWNPLDFYSKTGLALARDAAMATGAFPAGLRARVVVRDGARINQIPRLKKILEDNPLPPGPLPTTNIDGGMLNNEPFEKVKDVLWDLTGEAKLNSVVYDNCQSTVLMVDPFPSESSRFDPDDHLFNVLGNTLSAVRSHMLAKPEELEDAYASGDPRQYLIAPSRPHPTTNAPLEGSKAIACGSLGGFGGFIHKNFRIHDFFLGRANCERFLRYHFTIPFETANPIFVDGYATVQNKEAFRSPSATDRGLQIIPLFKPESAGLPLPDFGGGNWPLIREADVTRFDKLIRQRVEALILNIAEYKWMTRFLLFAGARIVLNRKIAEAVIGKVKASLREHGLV